MAIKKITGSSEITTDDYKAVVWTGKTKGGNPVSISLKNAINLGNTEWTFADKDETVQEILFTATQENIADRAEPWELTYNDDFTDDEQKDSIILGAGALSINGVKVAVTKGGGKFSIERTFREIEFDGAIGPVKNGITKDAVRVTLSMNVCTLLVNMKELYTAITVQPSE